MKKIVYLLLLTGAISLSGYAQQSVSIGTDQINSNAVLWLQGNGSQGLILPVVTNRTNVTAAKGMVVFDDSDKKVYYHSGTAWVEVGGGSGGNIQTLTLTGNTLSISGGNSVQIASTTPTVAGQLLQWDSGNARWTSTIATFPSVGQVLKWNGTTWTPSQDDVGGGAVPTLTAGQILVGDGTTNSAATLSGDATLTGGAISIQADAINSAKILDGSVTSTDIADGTIQGTDLNAMGGTNGQVLKFNGTTWAPGTDDVGGGATPTLSNGQILIGDGSTNSSAALSGDATLNGGNLTIANNAVTTAKIADGSVSSAKIADGTIAATDINAMGASNGQVLQFNGTQWGPVTLPAGSGTVTNVSGTGPISVANQTTTPVISISQANGSTNGFLTSVDWALFNAKLGPASTTGGDLSGTVINPTVVGIQGRAVANTAPTNGQILKFNGTSWAPASDDVGGGATPTLSNGQILVGDGSSNSGVALSGDATLSAGALTIANNAVNSAKIADGTIQAADLNAMGATANQVLQYNGTNWAPALLPVSTGTVSSVGLTLPAIFSVTGSPVTTSGTLAATLASQTAGTVFAAPAGSAGTPSFRALATTDIPSLDASKITTGVLPIAQGGTGANSPAGALTNLGAMSNTLSAGEIFVGSATNVATGVAVSGDATLSTAGTLTVANNAINSAKIADGSIVDADVNATAAIAGTKISPNFGAQLIQSTTGGNFNLTPAANQTGITVSVQGSGNSFGVNSNSFGVGSTNYGVYGQASNSPTNYGLYGSATGATGNNYGVYGRASGGVANWAGYFEGNLAITGGALGVGTAGSEDFGTAGQILTSAGPGASPTWTTVSGGGTLQSAYDGGNIVAGTNAIDLTLDNGFITKGTFGTGSIAATGAGVRMMFYPAKAAFRVGRTFDDSGSESGNWDDANIGEDSFAAGQNTVASGIRSFAVGKRATALGSASVAMGDGTTATRFGSVAMGFVSEAVGQEAFAVGRYSQAEARASVAMGHYNIGGGDPTAFNAGDPLFELGNGTGTGVLRSNAFTVLRNGKTSINGAGPVVSLEINGTDAILLPAGTDGERPGSPVAGYFRYNTTSGIVEYHNGGSWQSLSTGAASPLINNTGTRNLFAGVGVAAIGTDNAVFGHQAGQNNNTYNYSVIIGTQAGFNKQAGSLNTLVGYRAGYGAANYDASANTFIGADAGLSVSTGNVNTFVGEKAGQFVTTSARNVMIGKSAGDGTTTGAGQNVFIGNDVAGTNVNGSTLTIIGTDADVSAANLTNATALGFGATVNASNKVRIGNNAITVIEGQVAYTNASDVRLKKDIKNLDEGLVFINKLRPVSYQMKNGDDRRNWGFIAQEIESLVGTENAVLTVGNDDERTLGLRYSDFIAPLVKSIQELSDELERLKTENAQLKSENSSLESKVSAIEAQQQELAKSLDEIKRLLGAEAKN